MADSGEFPYAPEWANGQDYKKYWDHWKSLQTWYNKNYGNENYQSNYLNAYGHHLYLWNHYFQHFMQQYKFFTSQTLSQYAVENKPTNFNPYYESDEVDEADLEYKNFLRVSMEHKKERDKMKKCVNEMVYVNVSDLPKKSRILSPNQSDSRREKILKLYGNDGAKIHAMETALQLNFERKQDKLRPQVWPQLPLHIKFSDE
ncbi:DgyrCDS245 [Dimorphilus gyrociliatus]|uniref:DgyrCDS245 n=1 Tax=Dimorphilus gyrociliatus TaxID=2664684 RepID=A0A7I8V5H3_9ANNE|nr:DgyrCDS245 [Dimorphilus gyrociliatus]